MPRPHSASTPVRHSASTPARPSRSPAPGVAGWAAFSCVLVPVALVVCGTSLGGAAGAALGLVAVSGVCRMLLRRSERSTASLLAEQNAKRSESSAPGAGGSHGADRRAA